MRVLLVLNTHDVKSMAMLFTRLHERFPNAWAFFKQGHSDIDGNINPILTDGEHELTPEDRVFLHSLERSFLGDPETRDRPGLIYGFEEL